MEQDELNEELDDFLEEAIFNEAIDATNADQIKTYLLAIAYAVHSIDIDEKQWLFYATHCLQKSIEYSMSKKGGKIQ